MYKAKQDFYFVRVLFSKIPKFHLFHAATMVGREASRYRGYICKAFDSKKEVAADGRRDESECMTGCARKMCMRGCERKCVDAGYFGVRWMEDATEMVKMLMTRAHETRQRAGYPGLVHAS